MLHSRVETDSASHFRYHGQEARSNLVSALNALDQGMNFGFSRHAGVYYKDDLTATAS